MRQDEVSDARQNSRIWYDVGSAVNKDILAITLFIYVLDKPLKNFGMVSVIIRQEVLRLFLAQEKGSDRLCDQLSITPDQQNSGASLIMCRLMKCLLQDGPIKDELHNYKYTRIKIRF